MYIPFLIIISLLSLFPIGKIIGSLLMKYKKYVSGFFYALGFLSLLFLLSLNTQHNTGEFSIWLLWILLWLPILSKVGSLAIPQKLMLFRKEIGILMGVMALVHSAQYFIDEYSYWFWEKAFWLNPVGDITFSAWGMIALIITTVLTVTSNLWSIKKFGKSWKLLHRSVYALIIFALLHVTFLKLGGGGIEVYLSTFIPFYFYVVGKTLQWKGVKINFEEILTHFLKKMNIMK